MGRRTLTRGQRLSAWMSHIKADDEQLLAMLAREVRPRDRWLIPDLATLSAAQWRAAQHIYPLAPAGNIMSRLSDPVFLPVLLESMNDPYPAFLLDALSACGVKETATKLAITSMSAEIPREDSITMRKALQERARTILFFGDLGDPKLAEHYIRYTERATLDPLESNYIEHIDKEMEGRSAGFSIRRQPYYVRKLRDAALLALTKSKHPEAVSRLKNTYEADEIQGRITAAFALHSLGNDTGIELVRAYRDRQERTIPEIEERWSVISMNDVFHTPISYLEHPKLDELYLTRVNRGFHYGDKELAKNIDFVGRNRDEIMQTLGARIPVVQQQAAINKWK